MIVDVKMVLRLPHIFTDTGHDHLGLLTAISQDSSEEGEGERFNRLKRLS
jgi:hypothetical protein